jgi:hypothetical protein
MKSAFLATALFFVTFPSLAQSPNADFAFNLMQSNLDTQLENEGFEPAAIKLVRLVVWNAANKKICGLTAMKDDVIEFSAKEARIPLPILIDKAGAYISQFGFQESRRETAGLTSPPSKREY